MASADAAQRDALPAILSGRGKPRLVRRIAVNCETRDSDVKTESRVQSVSLDAVSVTPEPRPSSRPRPSIQVVFGNSIVGRHTLAAAKAVPPGFRPKLAGA